MTTIAKKHADLKDPYFGAPYIDVDVWRATPLRHRYVHGGFEKTETRFSFYFPPPEQYQGRYIHHLEGGGGGHDNQAVGDIEFAFSQGAFLTESNRGHFGGDLTITRTHPEVHTFRAASESTRFARILAEELYGRKAHHGYVFGGSGGSGPTVLCLENAPDVWDGCVPYVLGYRNAWSLGFSVQSNVVRILGEQKVQAIVDAMSPGGSGNPFSEGLTTDEREVLAALYRTGQPRGAEQVLLTSGFTGTFANHISALQEWDPTYIDDFWSKPGYMGGDGKLTNELISMKTTVVKVLTAKELRERAAALGTMRGRYLFARAKDEAKLGVVLKGLSDTSRAMGISVKALTGKAKGHELHTIMILDDVLTPSGRGRPASPADGGSNKEVILIGEADVPYRWEGLEPGDEVQVDNRKYLAYCYFHRHQVDETAQYAPYTVDGQPIYPQRPLYADAIFGGGPDYVITGKFKGKMIVVDNGSDAATLPTGGAAFHEFLKRTLGSRIDEQFRLFMQEHAAHGGPSTHPPTEPAMPGARLVEYKGILEQAIADLITWVEEGKAPSPTTKYSLNYDQRLTFAPTAAERGGIQPVVTARANGAVRTEVKVGEAVNFESLAEMPPNTGTIINIEWDWDGKAEYPEKESGIDGSKASLRVKRTHTYTKPGTYFPAVRVTAQREGELNGKLRRTMNLDRMRVIVT